MFPMGFDAFGLPAEGAAIKNNIHPKKWTYANIERMRTQMRSMGAMFDWEREAVSADAEYYKWTEWFFIQLYKHGLAYRKKATIKIKTAQIVWFAILWVLVLVFNFFVIINFDFLGMALVLCSSFLHYSYDGLIWKGSHWKGLNLRSSMMI